MRAVARLRVATAPPMGAQGPAWPAWQGPPLLPAPLPPPRSAWHRQVIIPGSPDKNGPGKGSGPGGGGGLYEVHADDVEVEVVAAGASIRHSRNLFLVHVEHVRLKRSRSGHLLVALAALEVLAALFGRTRVSGGFGAGGRFRPATSTRTAGLAEEGT
jgi:hypothetical protein